MFRIARDKSWPPEMDLSTVRETLAYMECDLRRVPGLERVADALSAAMVEVAEAERSVVRRQVYEPMPSRFLPSR